MKIKVLLNTNIVIHRETSRILNVDIGVLFQWLDKGKYFKCVHPVTVHEVRKNSNQETVNTLGIKLESYEVLKTVTSLRLSISHQIGHCITHKLATKKEL